MHKRILVLEDEEAIASMIAMNLKVAGMEPVVFSDGLKLQQALSGDHAWLLGWSVSGFSGF